MALRKVTRNFWVSLFAFVGSILSAAIIYFLLTRIDLIVHEELYNFGLQFSGEWADPYSYHMWLIYAFLILPIVLSSLALFFSYTAKEPQKEYHTQKGVHTPPPMKEEVVQKVERVERPASFEAKAREEPKTPLSSDGSLATFCPKCHRAFSRHVAMLDFSSGKPKIVNVCSYCN